MCTPKPPKVKASDEKPKDPAIIRNPYLDNATDFAEARMGRNALRIDPGTPRGVRIPLPGSAQQPAPNRPGRTGNMLDSSRPWAQLVGAALNR